MFGLSGLGLKMMIAGIIISVIGAAVGGFFLYQKSVVSDLQEIIDEKDALLFERQERISGLIIDNGNLATSVNSLEIEIGRKSEETKDVFAEITRLREKDTQSTIRLNEVENILRDRTRMDAVQSIRETRKSSLLLRLMDKNIKCYAENFEKVDGKCIRGKWIPSGERLVPEEPAEKTENE